MAYDLTNHYWFVSGITTQVWSSSIFNYVSIDDTTYQIWLAIPGNVPTAALSASDLSFVVQTQILPAYFNSTTINITSNSNASINSTYAIDAATLSQVGDVARDIASGLGLPLSASVFQYPDASGVSQTLNPENVKDLYKAMRDYIAAFSYAAQTIVMGGNVDFPSKDITIP